MTLPLTSRAATLLCLGGCLLGACQREKDKPTHPPLLIDARPTPPPSAPVAQPTAPATASSTPAPAPIAVGEPAPDLSAVEITGELELPLGANTRAGKLFVYVTTGDCLAANSNLLTRIPATDKNLFFLQVLASVGDQLSLCAALEPAPGRPASLYGQASARFTLQKSGDTTWHDVSISLKNGPAHLFPTPKPITRVLGQGL